MISLYFRLCDLIKQKDLKFIKERYRQNSEKEFIIASLKIIDDLFLNEKNDPSDFICLIRNFPNFKNYIIDKENAEILFIVMFIQFTLFLDDIEEFDSFYSDISDKKFEERIVMEDLVDIESISTIILEKRIDTFFNLSKQMLKKENGKEFWSITEIFNLTTKFINDENEGNCFKDLLISNGFIEVKNKTSGFCSKIDTLPYTDDNISFVSIKSFCVNNVFKDLLPQNQLFLDDTSMICAIYNSIEKGYPEEGTISLSFTNSKLYLEFIVRFFIFLKSYSPKSIRIDVSKNVNDLKISFDIKKSSLDYILDFNSNKIRYLTLLNKILHRRYVEFYVNLKSINYLESELNMVYDETKRRSGENRNRNSLISSNPSKKSFINQMISRFINMIRRKNCNTSEEYDFVSKSNSSDINLLNMLYNLSKIFESDDIYHFIYKNTVLNTNDLKLAQSFNSFPEYADISNAFFEYESSGYDLELLNNKYYNNRLKEIKNKQVALNKNYDIPSIVSYFKINVLKEDDEKKIVGRLLISIASYFENTH